MGGILAELSHWASGLPFWEQAALEKIITNNLLTEEDYDELMQYLLEDEGLATVRIRRPALHFPQESDLTPFFSPPGELVQAGPR